MKLSEYLTRERLTHAEFGRRIGRASQSVTRYCNGCREPDAETKRAIFFETNGAVTPNDFYEVGRWRAELRERRRLNKARTQEYSASTEA